ncbi:MAG: leucine--tRNA ligase [Patescibacteria group bacterium]
MYNHQELEKKWQRIWQEQDLYHTDDKRQKPKYYVLDMFPYPSGLGLHVGHPKGYIATDVLARLKMMQGFNVLHPMGFDAFGLPAENYALKNKVHPRVSTAQNVANYKKQLEIIGLAYDWQREINTTDPEYYKWTQWMFIKMWEKGLAYESYEPINWCPSCQTGLANEDLENGHCERCGSLVEQKPLRQWVLKITNYAERLLNDLDKLPDWEEATKDMQRNWIGRSEGVEVSFLIKNSPEQINVFTTRVDTIFGCTYLVLAPENPLVERLSSQINNLDAVRAYVNEIKNKSVLERTDLNKDKTGVLLNGIKAINPFNQEELDVFIADYVLNAYGTGAVMAVPAHDERDFAFAQKYQLKIKTVVVPEDTLIPRVHEAYTSDGLLTDSGEFSRLKSEAARAKMLRWLKNRKLGNKKINYKLKDWVFSRQRYWGEPIPMIHCPACGVVPVPLNQLPVVLPEVESYEPSGTGESPLAKIDSWVNVACPKCGGAAKRETNTMPQWAGSSWYYLRYIDPKNKEEFVNRRQEKYFSPVDFYVGGAEHATRHLIYARFWHKFLYDLKLVKYPEPFLKLKHVGLILGADGQKMSKRWNNVVNPDQAVADFGADALRVYEMFMGPFEQVGVWNNQGLVGARKFLERVSQLYEDNLPIKPDGSILGRLHKTIKKVGADIADFKFNTAISSLMILVNEISDFKSKEKAWPLSQEDWCKFIALLAPFAPHLCEELWSQQGKTDSIFRSVWPKFNKKLIKDEIISLVVQVNGKLRATLKVVSDISESEAKEAALADDGVKKWLEGKEIIRVIFVKGKLLNIVVK